MLPCLFVRPLDPSAKWPEYSFNIATPGGAWHLKVRPSAPRCHEAAGAELWRRGQLFGSGEQHCHSSLPPHRRSVDEPGSPALLTQIHAREQASLSCSRSRSRFLGARQMCINIGSSLRRVSRTLAVQAMVSSTAPLARRRAGLTMMAAAAREGAARPRLSHLPAARRSRSPISWPRLLPPRPCKRMRRSNTHPERRAGRRPAGGDSRARVNIVDGSCRMRV